MPVRQDFGLFVCVVAKAIRLVFFLLLFAFLQQRLDRLKTAKIQLLLDFFYNADGIFC